MPKIQLWARLAPSNGMWLALIPALVALIAAVRVAASVNPAPASAIDHGASTALTSSALLVRDSTQTVIWQQAGNDTALTATDLSGDSPDTPLLPYPGIEPQVWQAVPAGDDVFHLIWLDEGDWLRSALIGVDGQTRRGPIDLPLPQGANFVALPYGAAQALILAASPGDAQIAAVSIDATGRPRPVGSLSTGLAQAFATRIDSAGTLHLAWLSPGASGALDLNYAPVAVADLPLQESVTPHLLHTFDDEPATALATLDMGLDTTTSYVIAGFSRAEQPDAEQVQIVAFPLADPGTLTVTGLHLPPALPIWDVSAPPPVPITIQEAAPLRWPHAPLTPHTPFTLALAVRTPDGWQPAIAVFENGTLVSAGLVADQAADAGPPVIATDQTGVVELAWLGLDGAQPHLYTATTANSPADPQPDFGTTLTAAVAGLPLAILWLVMPTFLVYALARHPATALPLAAALYGASKLLFPPALLAGGPILLAAAGIAWPGQSILAGLSLAGTALVAVAVYRVVRRLHTPLWIAWLAYGAVDATLTWLLFGANLAG